MSYRDFCVKLLRKNMGNIACNPGLDPTVLQRQISGSCQCNKHCKNDNDYFPAFFNSFAILSELILFSGFETKQIKGFVNHLFLKTQR